MDWKPIETAPKDGRRLLLYGDDIHYGVTVGYWEPGNSDWLDAEGKDYIGRPTHWDDLPEPPKQ